MFNICYLQTNGRVDTESISDQMEIRSVVETFSTSGSGLIQWVSEIYGTLIAYSKVDVANKFTLVVDGGKKLRITLKFVLITGVM